jgi:uncharacterized Rossmann fold enzyme
VKVLGDGVTEGLQRIRSVEGELNVPVDTRYANIRSSICRGLTQVRGHNPNTLPICLVGGGPSLESTFHELQDLVKAGYRVMAMNGSYAWLIDHGITPTSMIIIDGRPFNARFITQHLPNCSYFLASQCAPEVFEKVKGWPRVFIWHCLTGDDPVEKKILDDYYMQCWQPISGGCTVGTRAIVLLRTLGFQSMHLFGMDSCYMDGEGHAYAQPENVHDGSTTIYCAGRKFECSAWHISQALEFMDLIAVNGEYFQLEVHGDGLLAHIIREGGSDDLRSQLDNL